MSLHATVREVRESRNLTTAQVAAALGVATSRYESWESRDGEDSSSDGAAERIDWYTVVGILGTSMSDLLARAELGPPSTDADVRNLWAAWGPAQDGPASAAAAISTWADQDRYITAVATSSGTAASLAARGVPGAGLSIFATQTLPALEAPPLDDEGGYVQYATAGRKVAEAALDVWGVTAADLDPWAIADDFGVPAGRAPLGQGVFAATARIGDGYAVVVNSDVDATWQRTALLHQLVHIALGHVVTASWEPIPDVDDDSIYACTGCAWELCGLVEHAVGWLLDPAGSMENLLATAEPYIFPEPTEPGPDRAPGEEPGHWEQYEVWVPPVSLRRELGLRHHSLLNPGPGTTTWPAALVRRWVAAAARSRVGSTAVAVHFPFGQPGCPTIGDVESALHRGQVIDAQLEAWNRAETRNVRQDDPAS